MIQVIRHGKNNTAEEGKHYLLIVGREPTPDEEASLKEEYAIKAKDSGTSEIIIALATSPIAAEFTDKNAPA